MSGERGAALVITLMAMLLLSALAGALVLATSADVAIAANAGASNEAFYGAEAVLERTIAELRSAPDFTQVLDGTLASLFVDGAPGGSRVLADNTTIVLEEAVNLATCNRRTTCSEADITASSRDRPWGVRNPRWRLFSYGPLTGDAGNGMKTMGVYVIGMVSDDPADTDLDPWRDGVRTGASANPGAGRLLVRAEGFGRRGAHRIIEGAVLRRDLAALALWDAADPATRGTPPSGVPALELTSWREVR
jgi:Tfp pilus assembly protein PilX